MKEEEFIKALQNEPDLFSRVYDQHYAAIFNYCLRRTSNFDLSKDLTAETFLKAFLNIRKFKWRGIPIIAWLYKIANNEVNLYFRNKKYKPRLLSQISYADKLPPEMTVNLWEEKIKAEDEIRRHDQFIKVQQVLKTLPVKYQEVISFKYFEKLRIQDISIILKKPEGTIKSLLSRGIEMLRSKL